MLLCINCPLTTRILLAFGDAELTDLSQRNETIDELTCSVCLIRLPYLLLQVWAGEYVYCGVAVMCQNALECKM